MARSTAILPIIFGFKQILLSKRLTDRLLVSRFHKGAVGRPSPGCCPARRHFSACPQSVLPSRCAARAASPGAARLSALPDPPRQNNHKSSLTVRLPGAAAECPAAGGSLFPNSPGGRRRAGCGRAPLPLIVTKGRFREGQFLTDLTNRHRVLPPFLFKGLMRSADQASPDTQLATSPSAWATLFLEMESPSLTTVALGCSSWMVLENPLPPWVVKGTIVLPLRSVCSSRV